MAGALAYPVAFRGLAGPFWGLAGALLGACDAGQSRQGLRCLFSLYIRTVLDACTVLWCMA